MVEVKIKCIHCESEEVVKMGYQKMIVKMSVNGSGIRDTARVLGISKDTCYFSFKEKKFLTNVNPKYINLKAFIHKS